MKPLLIPLRREWFEAFAAGTKTEEWRRYGPRWNEVHCVPGRPVILSLGYTMTRLAGRVVAFDRRIATGPAVAIYGEGTECAVITVQLENRTMATVTFRFIDHKTGRDVTGTEIVAGYVFQDYFDRDIRQIEEDHRRAPGEIRSLLAAAYRGKDADGIGVQWDVS